MSTRPRRPRTLAVTLVNRNMATVSGHGSRELLTELSGRPPVWSVLSRAWVTQPRRARDLIALAESRGFLVTVTEDDPLPAARGRLS